jgi:DNA-binding CsgD family transcriptional regulator
MRVPINANSEAVRLLGYRTTPAAGSDPLALLPEGLLAVLPAAEVPPEGLALSFLLGRRRYSCRVFRMAPLGPGSPAYLLMIDRASAMLGDDITAVQRYALTQREAELLRYLMTGLTNKEIGERMQISPNTVKAFLKLMMTKMGVSTRAAVVGRAFEGRAQAMAQAAGR